MPSLNFRQIEARLNQLVIDLHDAARLCEEVDIGVSQTLRRLAHKLHEIVVGIRKLLPSSADSGFSDSVTGD